MSLNFIRITCLLIYGILASSANAQIWQLSKPVENTPGFWLGYGENVYVSGENFPTLQLTRSLSQNTTTITLSDSTYPGRSRKAFPKIALAENGSALVFWIDGHDRYETKWRARKVSSDGHPQCQEIILSDIPTLSWWDDYASQWDLSSNGRQIVFTWELGADIFYQLYNFDGIPITAVSQANQDTIVASQYGPWSPGACTPSVFMCNNGEFVIAWQDERAARLAWDIDIYVPRGDIGEIYARKFDSKGVPIGDNFKVNSDSIPRIQALPSICMNDDGTILCLWSERDTTYEPSFENVRGRMIGKNFNREIEGSGATYSYSKPSVLASFRYFVALWVQANQLTVQAFNDRGYPQWQSQRVSDEGISNSSIVTLNNNFGVLAWSKWPANYKTDIRFCSLDLSNGLLGNEEILVTDGTLYTTAGSHEKGLGVAYLSEDQTAVGIAAADSNLLKTYAIKRLNDDFGGAKHEQPAAAKLGNGNILVVWTDQRSGILSVWGQLTSPDGLKIGENFPIYKPAQHQNHQTASVISLRDGSALVGYRSQANSPSGAFGAWIQRIDANGQLSGQALKMNNDTDTYIWDVQVAVSKFAPYHVIGIWRQGNDINARLFDSNFEVIKSIKKFAQGYISFSINSDKLGRFWLIGINNNHDVFLNGFDSDLSQIYGPTLLNESQGTVNYQIQPQVLSLSDGTTLTAWGMNYPRSWKIDGIYAQILNQDGVKAGRNFLISDALIEGYSRPIAGFASASSDTHFVVSWNITSSDILRKSHVALGWINKSGKIIAPPAMIKSVNFLNNFRLLLADSEQYIFIHEARGYANPIDISVDIFEPSKQFSKGWYSSPVFRNKDTLVWKKLSWIANTPSGTSSDVSFRCSNNLYNPLDEYIPWQKAANGQTVNLPRGLDAQWRVDFFGTDSTSPLLLDLIGEYDRIEGVDGNGITTFFTFRLFPIYPNPVNSMTTIRYEIPQRLEPTLILYNIMGQEINRWNLPEQTAGRHSLVWDGTNNSGIQVSSGIYFFKFQTSSFKAIQKITILR